MSKIQGIDLPSYSLYFLVRYQSWLEDSMDMEPIPILSILLLKPLPDE
jgi:hypothetical protein